MKEKWIQGDLFSTDNVEHIEKNSDPLLINESVPNKGNKGENSARENSGEKKQKKERMKKQIEKIQEINQKYFLMRR